MTAESWLHEAGDHDLSDAAQPRILVLIRGRARFQRLGLLRSSPCEGAEGMIWLCPPLRRQDGLSIRGGPVELLHLHLHDGETLAERAAALGVDTLDFSDLGGFRDAFIESTARIVLKELQSADSAAPLFVDTVGPMLHAYLLRRYAKMEGAAAPQPAARGALSVARLDRALTLIDERLADDLSLPELARAASLSVYHFARAFKAATGLAPHRYILERRVDKARQMLETADLSLAEVAERCGFASQAHMTHVFKRATGVTPGAFRAASRRERLA